MIITAGKGDEDIVVKDEEGVEEAEVEATSEEKIEEGIEVAEVDRMIEEDEVGQPQKEDQDQTKNDPSQNLQEVIVRRVVGIQGCSWAVLPEKLMRMTLDKASNHLDASERLP